MVFKERMSCKPIVGKMIGRSEKKKKKKKKYEDFDKLHVIFRLTYPGFSFYHSRSVYSENIGIMAKFARRTNIEVLRTSRSDSSSRPVNLVNVSCTTPSSSS